VTTDAGVPAETVEFAPDPKDRRRNLLIAVLFAVFAGLLIVLLEYYGDLRYLRHDHHYRPVLWILIAVGVLVGVVRIWQEAGPDGIRLRIAPDAMTLKFGRRETRLPWSDISELTLDRDTWLVVKPGPGLSLPGRWIQSSWLRITIIGLWGVKGAYELFVRPGYPKWSASYRDRITVLSVRWFPKADRERLVELVTRYANAQAGSTS
jgi:hypothetical protein